MSAPRFYVLGNGLGPFSVVDGHATPERRIYTFDYEQEASQKARELNENFTPGFGCWIED